MIWYHASRLHSMFRIGGADLSRLPGWLAQNGGAWNESILTHAPAFADDLLHPSEASRGCVEINALVNSLADVPLGRVQLLEFPSLWSKFAGENAEQVAGFHVDLARRIDLAPDALDSLLRRPAAADANRLFGESVAEQVFLRNTDEDIAVGIRGLGQAPYAQQSWTVLLASIRDLAAPSTCRDALREALQAVDFVEFMRREPDWACVALAFAAGHARFSTTRLSRGAWRNRSLLRLTSARTHPIRETLDFHYAFCRHCFRCRFGSTTMPPMRRISLAAWTS
jgi:hypothetical protein